MSLSAKIRDAEVVPQHFHVDCHIESARKARRHDLWCRDVLSRRHRSRRRPFGFKNKICFFKTLNVKFVYKKVKKKKVRPGTLVGQPTCRGPLVVYGGGAGADEGQVAAGGLVRPDCDRRWVDTTRARRFRAGWRLAVSRVRIAGAV